MIQLVQESLKERFLLVGYKIKSWLSSCWSHTTIQNKFSTSTSCTTIWSWLHPKRALPVASSKPTGMWKCLSHTGAWKTGTLQQISSSDYTTITGIDWLWMNWVHWLQSSVWQILNMLAGPWQRIPLCLDWWVHTTSLMQIKITQDQCKRESMTCFRPQEAVLIFLPTSWHRELSRPSSARHTWYPCRVY